ncbi:ABC transporter substrate-binding protein [Maribrevibacterium harenarium]|uniref:ABC transporter substrate-binding protein n=1 Tax=Maribrevibacterium harenarium TaxID=2589817 RepID=A0A501WU95_9GAMM|nr:ABC transporter substrate-binding protein [Maribrevibacterium harenarium]TPE50541.1 ABC transporter substrate-binding protein [Maribrevibacterium harenarium]
MKKLFWAFGLWLVSASQLVAEPVYFGRDDAPRYLHIQSALDLASVAPLLSQFVQSFSDIRIGYEDINTKELYQNVLLHQSNGASLIISSAMDLQLKLVNDGFARAYRSSQTLQLPSFAKWRDHLFAFSFEPVVMVLNKAAFASYSYPKDRQGLLAYVRQQGEAIRGKIGTYDIRQSGVGYLLASQDARQADTTWGRLLEAFGSHSVRTYCCTSEMIDDVAQGRLVIAYNLLGSYAAQRVREDDRLVMVLPKDYTLMVMRTLLIPVNAPNVEDAGLFIDFILSRASQQAMAREGLLYPVNSEVSEQTDNLTLPPGPTRSIELDQQLLVGRDLLKQRRFIESWETALELGVE